MKQTSLTPALISLLLLLSGIPLHTFAHGHCHSGHGHGHSGGHGHSHGHSYHGYSHTRFRMRGGGFSDGSTACNLPMAHNSIIGAGVGTADVVVANAATIKRFGPNYTLNYRYQFNNWLALDITAGISHLQGNDTCNCDPAQLLTYKYDIQSYHLAAGLALMYYSNGPFQIYGSLQAGIVSYREQDDYSDNTHESLNRIKPTINVTYLGLRFGKKIGAFVELSYGCKGLVNAGISYQPNWKE